MQQGSLIRSGRKRGPDVWQFRWADKGAHGKRVYRKRVIGTVCQYPDTDSAQSARGIVERSQHECFPVVPTLNDCCGSVRSLRSPGTGQGQYVAKLFHEEGVQSVPKAMDRSTLGKRASIGGKNYGGRVMAP